MHIALTCGHSAYITCWSSQALAEARALAGLPALRRRSNIIYMFIHVYMYMYIKFYIDIHMFFVHVYIHLYLQWHYTYIDNFIFIYIKIFSYISIYIKIYSYICLTIIISVLTSSSHFLRPAGLGSLAIMRLASRGSTALDTPAADNKHITICPSHIHRARHSTVRMLKPTVWLVGGFVVGASCVLCHFGSRMHLLLLLSHPPSLIYITFTVTFGFTKIF